MYPVVHLRRVFLQRWISSLTFNKARRGLFAEPPLIRVSEFEGLFRVGGDSDLLDRLLRTGQYEPELAHLTRKFIDSRRDVIDVGANVGFFTVLAAKHTKGTVWAIEPVQKIVSMLRANALLNNVDQKVHVFEGVLSDHNGEELMRVVEGKEEYSTVGVQLHPSSIGNPIKSVSVPSLTLDSIVLKNGIDVGFLKIDVEGNEHKVISGAKHTLENLRPVMLIEFSPKLIQKNGADPMDTLANLNSLEYHVIDTMFPDIRPGKRPFGELLVAPKEKCEAAQLHSAIHASYKSIKR